MLLNCIQTFRHSRGDPGLNDSIPNIWLMQTQRDSESLIAALRHPDPKVRRAAAVSLRIIGAEDATAHLREHLTSEPDPRVRVALMAALDHLDPRLTDTGSLINRKGKPQTRVERLIEHLTGNQPEAAIQAARALGEAGDKVAVPPLVIVFRNKRLQPAVRLAAAEALLVMNSAPAEVTLLAALRNEKWQLRRNGAAILGQLQATWAVEPLGAALHDENRQVAKTALAALRRIGTTNALEEIEKRRRATPIRKQGNKTRTKPLKLTPKAQEDAENRELARGLARKAAEKLASMGNNDAPTIANQTAAPPSPPSTPPNTAPPDPPELEIRPTDPNAPSADTRPIGQPSRNNATPADETQPNAESATNDTAQDAPPGWTGALKLPKDRRKSQRRKSATRRLDNPDDGDKNA